MQRNTRHGTAAGLAELVDSVYLRALAVVAAGLLLGFDLLADGPLPRSHRALQLVTGWAAPRPCQAEPAPATPSPRDRYPARVLT